jgi:hypothetical protein
MLHDSDSDDDDAMEAAEAAQQRHADQRNEEEAFMAQRRRGNCVDRPCFPRACDRCCCDCFVQCCSVRRSLCLTTYALLLLGLAAFLCFHFRWIEFDQSDE